jgi:hypothetical protein
MPRVMLCTNIPRRVLTFSTVGGKNLNIVEEELEWTTMIKILMDRKSVISHSKWTVRPSSTSCF